MTDTPDILKKITNRIQNQEQTKWQKFKPNAFSFAKRKKPVPVLELINNKNFFFITECKKASPSRGE
ncbi:MAG TPA: hypothetical protein VKS21_06770, partial [Spirochaetota bacterium]|nr:hypothetical protein [Spirochaetota bacterium]